MCSHCFHCRLHVVRSGAQQKHGNHTWACSQCAVRRASQQPSTAPPGLPLHSPTLKTALQTWLAICRCAATSPALRPTCHCTICVSLSNHTCACYRALAQLWPSYRSFCLNSNTTPLVGVCLLIATTISCSCSSSSLNQSTPSCVMSQDMPTPSGLQITSKSHTGTESSTAGARD